MKSLTVFLLFACYIIQAQDMSLYQKRNYVSDGDTLPYRILYPDGYDHAKEYPLILVLHGAGERGNDNELQLVHGAKLFADAATREKYPAIVIFPQCPRESYWSSVTITRGDGPLRLHFDYTNPITTPLRQAIQLVEQIMNDESVDKHRVYITGLSMGGMGTFEAVYRYPRTFAAALPICGGGDTTHYKKVKTPFWVFHGAADATVAVDYSRTMVEKLKALKVDVKYTEYPGVNHNSWDRAFAEPDFLAWMFQQKR